MKSKLILLLVTIALSAPVRAYDTWACAVWLCLPMGFQSVECGKARVAMVKRLFEGKSPVPSFNSCQVQGAEQTNENHYDYNVGPAALMGSYTTGSLVVKPESLIKDGVICNFRDSGQEEPRGCVATLRVIRVYENGQQMGLTYYRNVDGQDYVRNPITGVLYSTDDIPPEAIDGLY